MGSKMKHIAAKAITTIMLGLFLTGCATNQEKYDNAILEAMVDQNRNILATGYAVISIQQHDNPAQQRLLSIRASKLDAYRTLMEQVYGQYLDANTTVAQMVVESDSFRARVQGVTPVGDDTYETTLSLKRGIVNDLRALYLEQLGSGMGN